MVHHVDSGALHAQQFFHLGCREPRDRDDDVGLCGRPASLLSEALFEFRGRVVSRQDKQVVERSHRLSKTNGGHTLIQTVEELARARKQRLVKQLPATIGGQGPGHPAQVAMRPVAEREFLIWMLRRQPVQQLARVHAHAREIVPYAVRCVE